MTQKMTESERKNKWTRIDGFVAPAQHKLIKEIAHRENISMAEVIRVFIDIATYMLMGETDKAAATASSFRNTPREVINQYMQ